VLDDDQLCLRAWNGLPATLLAQADSPDFVRQLGLHESQIRRERSQDNTGEMLSIAKAAAAQSWVSLPLRHRGQPEGLLVLASRDYNGFDSAAIDFLAAAGEQIGLGLRNAQLYAEAQRRASELALISQATHAVSSTLNLETVLQTIMSQAIQVLQVEAGSVLLLEESSGDLMFAAAAGPSGERLQGTRVPIATSIAGQAVREGRSLMVTDAQHHNRLYRAVDDLSGLTTQSLLAVPLQAHGRTIGVLEAMNKLDGEFSPADLALLEALAGPAATAIENARLYEAALRHAEEIQRSQQQLIRSEKLAATGRLAVSLAHEINNPLQAIRNLLFLTLEPEVNEAKRHEFLEMASEETSRLITLIQQTLEFYRPAQAEAGPVDINAAVERVLALARKKLAHSEVEVELALASGLPPVIGMPDQLAQVFLNLIVNAAEAMTDGGKLCIESRVDDDHIQVIFADTGPGIAPEDLPHIFEPFYTTKDSGTGLGLAVSYNIIESHQGTLSVESVPGHGATFTVRLPAALQPKPTKRGKRKTSDVKRQT
jgi:signal transduction histidine kinase